MTFPQFVASLGIVYPDNLTPGRWTRTGTTANPRGKSASVMLDASREYGMAQDWATMAECAVWTPHNGQERSAEQASADNAALSARIALRRQEEAKGTMRAKAAYEAATGLLHANHEYLRRKGLDMLGCRGLKVDKDGWLVVPMYRDGKLISVQRISPDGEKRFAPGAPTKGAFFTIWRPGAPVRILCEGLATGLSIFAACPMAQVLVCFSAANLIAVAEREEWSGMVGIGSDNDHWTEERDGKNPGKEAASRAAEIIGCGFAFPEHIEGTDWHDFMIERLELLEKSNLEKSYPDGPRKLRQSALLPIRTALMSACRPCGQPHQQK